MRKSTTRAGFAILSAASMLLLQSCPKGIHIGCGGPMPGNEPTSVMLVFQNAGNATDADTAIWSNLNANGSGALVIDGSRARLTLAANAHYHVQVFFLNALAAVGSSGYYNPTQGVSNESKYYLVCFDDSTNIYGNLGASLGYEIMDHDNGTPQLPLGLVDSFWTGADSACGVLQTTLHHQYQVKNGSCGAGYVDIQAFDTVYVSPGKG